MSRTCLEIVDEQQETKTFPELECTGLVEVIEKILTSSNTDKKIKKWTSKLFNKFEEKKVCLKGTRGCSEMATERLDESEWQKLPSKTLKSLQEHVGALHLCATHAKILNEKIQGREQEPSSHVCAQENCKEEHNVNSRYCERHLQEVLRQDLENVTRAGLQCVRTRCCGIGVVQDSNDYWLCEKHKDEGTFDV